MDDVEEFVAGSKLKFGSIHKADGYSFVNAKDVDGNSVQVSGRKFKK